jgi:hypothetical protein
MSRAALAVLAFSALSAVFAADNDGETVPVAQSAESADTDRARSSDGDERQKSRETRRQPRIGDDLESCKRDADGMRGPERSRFMTQCLKERK